MAIFHDLLDLPRNIWMSRRKIRFLTKVRSKIIQLQLAQVETVAFPLTQSNCLRELTRGVRPLPVQKVVRLPRPLPEYWHKGTAVYALRCGQTCNFRAGWHHVP